MNNYPMSFVDWLNKQRDMSAVGAQSPMLPGSMGFGFSMPNANQQPMGEPQAQIGTFGSPATDGMGVMGGGIDPPYTPMGGDMGSPTGDQGGIMGGGASTADPATKAGGWTDKQMAGGMAAAKGLGAAMSAMTGGDQKMMPVPNLTDNSSAIRQQASQMWQQVMQKKQRGLI
jgi:hypothetical protein